MSLNAVIIEDEPRAARRLQKLIAEVAPEVQVHAMLESVEESIRYFSGKPDLDLIFSDIQLADDLSFSIFKQVGHVAPVFLQPLMMRMPSRPSRPMASTICSNPYLLKTFPRLLQNTGHWFKKKKPRNRLPGSKSPICCKTKQQKNRPTKSALW
jgi:hypothetical protein